MATDNALKSHEYKKKLLGNGKLDYQFFLDSIAGGRLDVPHCWDLPKIYYPYRSDLHMRYTHLGLRVKGIELSTDYVPGFTFMWCLLHDLAFDPDILWENMRRFRTSSELALLIRKAMEQLHLSLIDQKGREAYPELFVLIWDMVAKLPFHLQANFMLGYFTDLKIDVFMYPMIYDRVQDTIKRSASVGFHVHVPSMKLFALRDTDFIAFVKYLSQEDNREGLEGAMTIWLKTSPPNIKFQGYIPDWTSLSAFLQRNPWARRFKRADAAAYRTMFGWSLASEGEDRDAILGDYVDFE